MPYLQRNRAQPMSSLMAHVVLWVSVVTILCGCTILLTAKQVAAETTPDPIEESRCAEKETWVEWEALLAKNPGNLDIHTLYALRVGLCTEVAKGRISVRDGGVIFERARKALLQKVGEPRAQAQPKL